MESQQNILTKNELAVLELYRQHPFFKATLKEIQTALKKTSYDWTYKTLKKFPRLGILNVKIIGRRTRVYFLSLENQKTIYYMGILEQQAVDRAKNLPKNVINDVTEAVRKETKHFIILITGSHVTGTAKTGSDLDLVVIVPTKALKKAVKPRVVDATILSPVTVDYHLFSDDEVIKMWLWDQANFGKEFFKKHLIFYGIEAYYELVKEAMHHGFQG